jgi:hypothetical protein
MEQERVNVRSSFGNNAVGPAAYALTPASLLATADSSLDDRDDDHVPEDPKASSRHHAFGVVTERVQDAMSFIVAPAPPIRLDEAPLNYDQMVARNLRLEDTCKVFLASSAEIPKIDKSKITAKIMSSLYGSAIREQGRSLARTRKKEQQDEKA